MEMMTFLTPSHLKLTPTSQRSTPSPMTMVSFVLRETTSRRSALSSTRCTWTQPKATRSVLSQLKLLQDLLVKTTKTQTQVSRHSSTRLSTASLSMSTSSPTAGTQKQARSSTTRRLTHMSFSHLRSSHSLLQLLMLTSSLTSMRNLMRLRTMSTLTLVQTSMMSLRLHIRHLVLLSRKLHSFLKTLMHLVSMTHMQLSSKKHKQLFRKHIALSNRSSLAQSQMMTRLHRLDSTGQW